MNCKTLAYEKKLRSVHHFYARATSYEELHKRTKEKKCLWAQYVPNTSFKFEVRAYNHTIPKRRQRDVIESFSFMDFRGLIDMTNPEIIMNVFEEC
jgi:tRNA (guanine10-N2)-methyltransferase